MSVERNDGAAAGIEADERMVLGSSPLPAAVPSRVLIAPWGEVMSAHGAFVMDEEAGRAVLEAFARHGTDVPVDYEHQSLGGAYSSPSGQAPAAGWIRALRVVRPGEGEPGLYAEVEWTEAGTARLAAREYRYLSPVVMVRKGDRRVVAVHSVALTNKPAIAGMRPIVNREAMMMEEGRGVRDEGEAITGGTPVPHGTPALQEAPMLPVHGRNECVAEMLRLRLGLPVESGVEAVLMAASERLNALSAELTEREARQRVESAFRAGKLSGAQEEWAMRLALEAPDRFDEWLESAPVLVSIGRTAPPADGAVPCGRNRSVVAASARVAFRAEPALALLTSEEAWVEEALREAGMA